jgi:hypothetical protein
MRSGCDIRIPCFTVISNSVDRFMRLRTDNTAKNPALRSSSQGAAALTAPVGHDRTAGSSAHPQAEAMHAGSPPVVRLKGALALGHHVLLVVSRSGNPNHPAVLRLFVRGSVGDGSCSLAGAVPSHGSQPYRRRSGDCLRVLTCCRRVKPSLHQHSRLNSPGSEATRARGAGRLPAASRTRPR